jgi:hypothetical protein
MDAILPHDADGEPIDLRAFFRSVGQFRGDRALTSTPTERTNPDQPVVNIDAAPARIDVQALRVAGFVDGVQAAMTVTWREHRPVYFAYTAAGCVGEQGRLLVSREKLEIICSELDHDWIESLGHPIDVHRLDESQPDLIERAALASLAAQRDDHERNVIADLLTRMDLPVIVDGSLIARPVDNRICAVVKTTRRRWLADETVLWGLPEGWRSPRFVIPSGSQGVPVDRYSCYLRLFDASQRSWDYGLVRLETFDPSLLEPLAALALAERQSPGAGDPRADRHLAGVRTCEQVLRARRPAVFGL